MIIWSRGQDSNLRPLGYEPNELPDCSTPHWYAVYNLCLLFSSQIEVDENNEVKCIVKLYKIYGNSPNTKRDITLIDNIILLLDIVEINSSRSSK